MRQRLVKFRAAEALLLALALLLAGGSGALRAQEEAETPPLPAQSFVIGVGDVLGVSVWKDSELQVTVPVRPDGKISLPLVGEVEAAGRTPADVRRTLIESYEQFITAPAVSLFIQQINSRKFFIIGEVASSGAYDILQPTTLMQALAIAGGLTDYAKKDQVVILRDTPDGVVRRTVSIKSIENGRRLEDNLQIQPGDTIIVP